MKAQKEKIILKEKRQTYDLIFLIVLFILSICLLESTMNLSKWLKLIRTRTCFLKSIIRQKYGQTLVRLGLRYRSSIIISLQQEKRGYVTSQSHDMIS